MEHSIEDFLLGELGTGQTERVKKRFWLQHGLAMSNSTLQTSTTGLNQLLHQYYGTPLRVLARIVEAQSSLLRLPLDGCRWLVEICLTLFLRLLVILGISTPGFISREQVTLCCMEVYPSDDSPTATEAPTSLAVGLLGAA